MGSARTPTLHRLRDGRAQAQWLTAKGADKCEVPSPSGQQGERAHISQSTGGDIANLTEEFLHALPGLISV